jgi:hypothetical protein
LRHPYGRGFHLHVLSQISLVDLMKLDPYSAPGPAIGADLSRYLTWLELDVVLGNGPVTSASRFKATDRPKRLARKRDAMDKGKPLYYETSSDGV